MFTFRRKLSPQERQAWDYYDKLIHKHGVRKYDRASVHRNFPDIKKAFDDARSAGLLYHMQNSFKDDSTQDGEEE